MFSVCPFMDSSFEVKAGYYIICEPVLTLLENWGASQQGYLFSLGVLLQYAAPGVTIVADGD